MAKKRTKAGRLQRQTEQLEKKADRRPDQTEKKKTTHEDVNEAAAQTVREVTEGRQFGCSFPGFHSLEMNPCQTTPLHAGLEKKSRPPQD
jgi:hypothetical protein